jgi:putative nucleic acid binding protein
MRKVLILLVVVSVVSLGIGYYMYNMPPKNLSNVKPEAIVSAVDLMSLFEENEQSANEAYLGKVIEVNGKISDVRINSDGSAQIVLETSSLMGGISCSIETEDVEILNANPVSGQNAVIKGECTGYLADVILKRCVVVNLIE